MNCGPSGHNVSLLAHTGLWECFARLPWDYGFTSRLVPPIRRIGIGLGWLRSNSGTAWLTIRRTSPDDVQHRELYASLDGNRIAIILYGDVATVAIAPGHHELRVHNTLSRKRAEFDAAPGQHVRFTAANVPSKGFAYWAFFVGAALMWTTLEREEDGSPPAGPVKETFRV